MTHQSEQDVALFVFGFILVLIFVIISALAMVQTARNSTISTGSCAFGMATIVIVMLAAGAVLLIVGTLVDEPPKELTITSPG